MNRAQSLPVLATLGASLCYAAPAFAYLDPGTGSMILQGLIATIAGAMVVGRLYWERLKQFFSGTSSNGENKPSGAALTDADEADRNDDTK